MTVRDQHLIWRETGSRLLRRCGIFDLYRSRRRAADGRQGDFFLLEARDWVNVVPVVAEEGGTACFLMVRQFRQGLNRITVEFPAGLVEAGERPEEAARRELLEETGFGAGRLQPIGTIAPNPAFMTNLCHTFLARELEERSSPALDELELLELLRVPVTELRQSIGREPYLNAMTAVALYWYERTLEGTGADRNRTGA